MKIKNIEKIKRIFCDYVIVFLASLIRKCSKKEEFINHLNKLDENENDSAKYKVIESKKEELYNAVEKVKCDMNQSKDYICELLIAIDMIENLIRENEFEKAHQICLTVLEDNKTKRN